jgi:hypothetical protein
MAESMWLRTAHVGRDRRSDSRTLCEGQTVIDVLSPHARNSIQARILDVGTSSLKLSVPFYLAPGSLIRIHVGDSIADAEVRYCSCEGAEYRVGVRVEEILPKDSQDSRPS